MQTLKSQKLVKAISACKTSKIYLCLIFLLFPAVNAYSDINSSVVKIYTVSSEFDYASPWQYSESTDIFGSGCIIDNHRILTNAHVVAGYKFIQVRRAGHVKKYKAVVEYFAHDCDLALLRVEDDSFFTGSTAFEIGELPKIRDRITVYGFPEGGDELSITEGVISRIEHELFPTSIVKLLTCQIDAALNPGNSGGPVVKNDKLIGVAFKVGTGENVGYIIPSPIIYRFLSDIKDGHYDGIPDLLITYQPMENYFLHKKFKMSEKQSGVIINRIHTGSPVESVLKTDDIILSIDGHNIENDGSTVLRKGEKLSFEYIIQQKLLYTTVQIEVLRNGVVEIKNIKLSKTINDVSLIPCLPVDKPPSYYILAGLLFRPVAVNYLRLWGDKWYDDAPKLLLHQIFTGFPTSERKEIVILSKVLAADINTGYHDYRDMVIESVNGIRITSLVDLVKAIEGHQGDYHVIESDSGQKVILGRKEAKESTPEILRTYGINALCSEDLAEIVK
ncbi:MAG TPA: serine protease [Spirochaetota bacterium]|nr:serine protease [Spirochaetota bacterium]